MLEKLTRRELTRIEIITGLRAGKLHLYGAGPFHFFSCIAVAFEVYLLSASSADGDGFVAMRSALEQFNFFII